MAAITICSDFGAHKNSQPLFPLFPHLISMKWWDQMPWSFKPAFSLSSFTFIKRLFNSLLSPIRVVSSAYLRLLIFLPPILSPAWALSSPSLCLKYSANKLNKQGDNSQPWHTPFPYLDQVHHSTSGFNCCFLTCIHISKEAGKVVWNSHLFKNFPQFVVIHTVKGFGIVSKAEADVFLKFSCFFNDQMLAICSLVPLPFLNPAWTSGSSSFT